MRNTGFPDPREVWTDDEARLVLERWQRGGESMAAFARKHGVAPQRIHYWRKKRLSSKSTATPVISLVPATVIAPAEAAIAIRLPNGVVIEVASATPTWVATIVTELTRPT